MSDSLDQMLEPGERVVFRTGPVRWPPAALETAAAGFAVLAAMVWSGLVDPGVRGNIVGTFWTLLTLFGTVALWRLERSAEAVVGTGRLLHRIGPDDPDTTAIPLAEIEWAEVHDDGLLVTRSGGGSKLLALPRDAAELSLALAGEAGLPPPRVLTAKESRARRFLAGFAFTCGLGAAAIFLRWQLAAFDAGEALPSVASVGLTGALIVLAVLIFNGVRILGHFIGPVLLRTAFTVADLANWIAAVQQRARRPDEPQHDPRITRGALGLARRVLGPRPRQALPWPDTLLEHRETVVYRAPRRWEPDDWLIEWSIRGAAVAILAVAGVIGPDPASLAALGAALAGLVLFVLGWYLRNPSRETAVTDKRLLHRAGWLVPRLTAVRAEDVRKVEAFKGRLRVTRRDGTRLDLFHPHHCRELGEHFARQAGLAPPRRQPRHERLADHLWELLGMTAGIAAAVVPLKWLYPELAAVAGTTGWVAPAGLFLLLGWLLHLIGMLCGGYVALVLLRPFLGYAEMRDWIAHSTLFWPAPQTPDEPDVTARAQRIAALLYGKPAPREEAGHDGG